MAEDPGFTISWFWVVAQGISFVLFIFMIVVIGLVLRRLLTRGRKLAQLDARVSRIEQSLEAAETAEQPEP